MQAAVHACHLLGGEIPSLNAVYVQASVWYGCVLRGDLNAIRIGAFTNIQDRTVIHAARYAPLPLLMKPICFHTGASPDRAASMFVNWQL